MAPDFANKRLVKKYGSWFRVQVAFYDFLFSVGSRAHAGCFNREAIAEVAAGEWRDGGNIYEKATQEIERSFSSPESAWKAFLRDEE